MRSITTKTISRTGLLAFLAASVFLPAAFAQQKAAQPTGGGAEYKALVNQYCVSCHSDKAKTAGLSLESLDVSDPTQRPDVWEKVIRKLRAGAMPPLGMPHPDRAVSDKFAGYLEDTLDRYAVSNPNPGRPLIHRLNRTEYANAVRDMLDVDVDVEALLPADSPNYGFDNNADSLTASPALLEKYLDVADQVSLLALGNAKARPRTTVMTVPYDDSQNQHMEGLPLGSSGGKMVRYNFPADGEYILKGALYRPTVAPNSDRGIAGQDHPEYFEITVDGKRVLLTHFGGKEETWENEKAPPAHRLDVARRMQTTAFIKAGVHEVTFTFVNRKLHAITKESLYRPMGRTSLLGNEGGGPAQLGSVTISGPYNPVGVSDTESRRRVFVCHPATENDEMPCARQIVSSLARKAFRRPLTDGDMETLMGFYQRGKNEGTFEDGIRLALSATLTDPAFLFRTEIDPAGATDAGNYRISDLELASRLSFFLWGSIPDDELLNVATQGRLKDPAVLEKEVRRMLADHRSHDMMVNFTGQWLGLRALPMATPDTLMFQDFDDHLRQGFRTETEMFVESILREDRSVLDLLTANYTFVNEKLAKHYGMQNGPLGEEFHRVTIMDENRRGLLGQGSVLTLSSPATRTSPVKRGKWILTTLLSIPPPPPPPNVPPLAENAAGSAPKSVRERMEAHRANAFCAGCHKTIDPVGFSLENFNPVGQWRDTTEDGKAVDAAGVLWDGTKVSSVADLRKAILARSDLFVSTVTERLLTFALGRGVEPSEMPVVRAIDRDAAKSDYKLTSIILGIVKSTPFQMRSKSPLQETEKSGGTSAGGGQ